ncbi:MAG: phosphotransferase family protein [Jiangellaceae bacterium]
MTDLRADLAGEVRPEDAFDLGALTAWLAGHVDGLHGVPEVRQFTGGASNRTFLLRYPSRDLVLRCPPGGTRPSSGHDMRREYVVQQRLRPVFPYVPAVVALCEDPGVIGVPFNVVQRLEGPILRRSVPPGVTLDHATARRLCGEFVDRLVELHSVDVGAVGLDDLGPGPGYVARQVAGWAERYRQARTDDVPDFEPVMAWLAERQPADVGSCLVHNDFRLDNVVLDPSDPGRIVGILDWEMATVGDPLMDLGGGLAYWVQSDDDEEYRSLRRQPTHLPGMLTRTEIVAAYTEQRDLATRDWAFYEVFGLFRLAGIAQQIHYRYHHRQTTNPAFSHLGRSVQKLARRCARLIDGATP